MKLYEPFPDRIAVDGQEYRLTLWFDRVLRFYDVLDDPDLTPEEKTETGFAWLVDCRKSPPVEVQNRVLQQLMSVVISPPQRRLSTQKQPTKCVDFGFDAEEIYSSFRQVYGIDLIHECGRLHWCAFLAMFHGLPENTPIKQIMRIRSEDIPAPNKHNAEHIRRLTELKTLYALPNKDSGQAQGGDGWDGLFNMLLAQAKEVE